jgi:hypothetical protein
MASFVDLLIETRQLGIACVCVLGVNLLFLCEILQGRARRADGSGAATSVRPLEG